MNYSSLEEVWADPPSQNQHNQSQQYDDDENLECNFFMDHIEKCEKCRNVLKNKFNSGSISGLGSRSGFASRSGSISDMNILDIGIRDKSSDKDTNSRKLIKRQLEMKADGEMLNELQDEMLSGYNYREGEKYLQIEDTKDLKLRRGILDDCIDCEDDKDKNGKIKEGFINRGRPRRGRRFRKSDENNDIILLILLGIFVIFFMDSVTKMRTKK